MQHRLVLAPTKPTEDLFLLCREPFTSVEDGEGRIGMASQNDMVVRCGFAVGRREPYERTFRCVCRGTDGFDGGRQM